MIEDKRHQLDGLKLSDILSYCGCRAFTAEEYIRGANKQIETLTDRLNKKSSQLAKVKFALRNVIDYLGQFCPDCWVAEPSSLEIDPPIAWCEIPKFEEEQNG